MRVNSIGAFSALNSITALQNSRKVQTNPILPFDSISFTSKYINKPVNVDYETAKIVANSLSTSTSGHRAEYGSEVFNDDIVKLITLGVADYAKEQAKNSYPKRNPIVLIGGDTRKATVDSLPIIDETLQKQGIEVIHIDKAIPTPALAYAAKVYDVDAAVLMTASHNPWSDGGYNMVTKEGAIAPAHVTQKVASYMLEHAKKGYYKELKNPQKDSPAVSHRLFPYQNYKKLLNSHEIIDWENIKSSGLHIFYDGLQGSGNNIMPRLLNDYQIPNTIVQSKGQEGPNPTEKNLIQLASEVKSSDSKLKIGLANDGDADRFGVIDENGKFVSTNDVLLLAAYHLIKNRGIEGIILRSHATASQLDEIADIYDMPVSVTPVGFKFIGEDILDLRKHGKDIILAGEESGGFTINSHVPEKDGILATLLIADLVAQEEKPLSEILADVKSMLNNVHVTKSINLKLKDNAKKDAIIYRAKELFNNAMRGSDTSFGDLEIDVDKTWYHQKHMERYKKGGDGVMLYFNEGSSLLIRKSGTEPLIRYYIEAVGKSEESAKDKQDYIESLLGLYF